VKLVQVQITKFRNILDSSTVAIEDKITCLVGKNESGKTAFLQALYRLKPARENVAFNVPDHYPAWLEKKDRLKGLTLEDICPVVALYAIEDEDRGILDSRFGKDALGAAPVSIGKSYRNEMVVKFESNEAAAVQHVISDVSIPEGISIPLKEVADFSTLQEVLKQRHVVLQKEEAEAEPEEKKALTLQVSSFVEYMKAIDSKKKAMLGADDFVSALEKAILALVPKFFYYSEYSNLPYSVKIQDVLKVADSNLKDSQLTARSLLRMAGAEDAYLLNPDYERRKRELENVANALTDDVLKYWTQNPQLRVLPDITQKTETDSRGQHSVIDELKVRIWDERHSLSLPFDEHSAGFRWFFSFLAAFSEYEFSPRPVVILLDEPALGLHARAQADFLKFIEEKLSQRCQVLYTTHSPFMVQPGKLESVRIVEDRGREEGSKITADVFTTDPDTLFPLQGALGYDLAQHLFISPNNLIVEGTSDYTYLVVLSEYLREKGRTCLDESWSVIPVGSADYIPSFVSLLGHHLDVTVLVDSRKGGHQRLADLAKKGYLKDKRIIDVGTVLGKPLADIEDVFAVADYLRLYNLTFAKNVYVKDVGGSDPIIQMLARRDGVTRFDHGKPADYLLRNRDKLLPQLEEETLSSFEKLFVRVNATLGK
jgi:energy-coupling factor transporter ATP-binding protein EcfA2